MALRLTAADRAAWARYERENRRALNALPSHEIVVRPVVRKTHCKRGHDLAGAYERKNGTRDCRVCRLDKQRAGRARRGKR